MMKLLTQHSTRRFAMAVLFVVMAIVTNAQKWDAVTCADLCNIVANNGYNIDDILVRKYDYFIVNNFNTDEGFGSIYSRNVNYDAYLEPKSLSKAGVSSIIMANMRSNGPVTVQITLFSATNAQIFRNQMLELGFKKTKVTKGTTYYVLGDFVIEEDKQQKAKQFIFFNFRVQPAYMY